MTAPLDMLQMAQGLAAAGLAAGAAGGLT